MIRKFTTAAVCLSLTGAPIFLGCDKTVDEKKTETTHSDGSKTTDMTKTTQSPDGSTQTKSEHTNDK